MIDGSALSAGATAQMVAFLGDAWPIVVPLGAIALAGSVLLVARRMWS